ncbi:ABC transporter permease [candidate division KSB1 bacterium]|nr:ABC transporter permease [candidate division KSB1 bacterium]
MFKNYLKIAYRFILKQKSYALINIAGLSIGLACSMIIILYISTELGYDTFHTNAPRIIRIASNLTLGGTTTPIATTNYPPAIAMRNDLPEVIDATRFRTMRKLTVKYQDKLFVEEKGYFADASVFDVFTFPMVQGAPKTALASPFSIVLTESLKRKYFGDSNPIGQILKINGQYNYTVTGVMRDLPSNSHIQFDMLASFQTLSSLNQDIESWLTGFSNYSYILVTGDANIRELEQKLPAMVKQYIGDDFAKAGVAVEYFLQPMTDIHLHSHLRHEMSENSDILYVYVFSAIGALILFIACINFMNLATARSAKRAREIGLRKVIGGNRQQLVMQFFGESLLYSVVSFIIALAVVFITLPFFASIADRDLHTQFLNSPWLISGFLGLACVAGIIAGSYPALYLSSFQPIDVLKNKLNVNTSNARFRQALVVIQFVISISLIVGTVVIIRQLQYIKNKSLGFDKQQVVALPLIDQNAKQSIPTLKAELRNIPTVVNVAASSHYPGQESSGGSFAPEGLPEGQTMMMNFMSIDPDLLPTLDIQFSEGRNFSEQMTSDKENSILINEATARELGWTQPLGKRIGSGDGQDYKKIVGVVKDFHYRSARQIIEPLYIGYDPTFLRSIMVKIQPGNIPATLADIKRVWQASDPNRAFDYFFLDESFDQQYRTDEKLRAIFSYFTALAIFIACLGLLGLASFMAEQRTKEIGIRKILGASVSGVVVMLSKEIAMWVAVASLIAAPVSWIAMNHWLRQFAYRINMNPGTFLLAGIVALIIALATIIWQAIRAATANPVDALRYE